MKKVILSIITFILFFPLTVDAASCTKDQISRYEKLASDIQATLDYVEKNNDISFTITFHNVHNELYLVDYSTFDNISIYKNAGSSIIEVTDYKPGNSYTFHILNNDKKCTTEIISKITVSVPFYNSYYKDPLCQGIETYSLCQKWNNIGNMSYKDFQKSVNEYKKKLEESDTNQDIVIEDNLWNQIRNFVANYYLYIVIVIVIIASIIVYIVHKKKKNDKW